MLRLRNDRSVVIKKRKESTDSQECVPYIGEPKIEIATEIYYIFWYFNNYYYYSTISI